MLLSGCRTVKFPGATDETPPTGVELTVETQPSASEQKNAQYDKHRLHADIRRAGSEVWTTARSTISSDATIMVRASGNDEESGIKEIRVTGAARVCQADPHGGIPRPVNYQTPHEWVLKDFAPNGKGRIPKKATVEAKISVAPLMQGTGGVAGDGGSFLFSVEVTNGAGRQSNSQWLEYRVGKIACP